MIFNSCLSGRLGISENKIGGIPLVDKEFLVAAINFRREILRFQELPLTEMSNSPIEEFQAWK